MSDKKPIDKLFKEQFKDFESAPNDAVWSRIEESLHKKKKRRIVPIWWQLGGVAAVLLLLLTVGTIFFSPESDGIPADTVVDTEKEKGAIQLNESSSQKTEQNPSTQNTTVADYSSEELTPEDVSGTSNKPTSESTVTRSKGYNGSEGVAKAAISEDKQANNDASAVKSSNSTNQLNNAKNAVVGNTTSNEDKKGVSESNPNEGLREVFNKEREKSPLKTAVAQNSEATKDQDQKKTSGPVQNIQQDPVKEKNAIEEAMAQTDSEKEEEKVEKLNRWSISPNVAPVYFNTLGNGSSIGNDFVNNDRDGEINMSYGVLGSYAISDKIKIRAGINKVELGYNTQNVLVYGGGSPPSALVASTNSFADSEVQEFTTTSRARNTNINLSSENTAVLSANNIRLVSAPEIIASQQLSSLDQQLGFIEIPLEMEYSLLNTKVGLNLIGGFSTLILDTNNVYSVSNGERTFLGEASNLNETSFSANVGFGLNYHMTEKLRLNLEPTFKYQLNTFNEVSGDFRPYFLGVYSGISFKF